MLRAGCYVQGAGARVRVLLPGTRDLAPDGRFLMVKVLADVRTAHVSRLVYVQNWVEEIKRRLPPATR